MKDQYLQKNQSDTQIFQKYPKNYQQNKHYKSVKQKLMTFQDQQEIIKFPFSANIHSNRKLSNQFSPNNRKIQKYKGKKYQTIPLRTISYSTPHNKQKIDLQIGNLKSARKSQQQNKFNSKNIFTNMKKLKDLRKNNYKSRMTSRQKHQQLQIKNDQHKLDLFKLTSTNFNYQDKMYYDSPEDVQLVKKYNHTQGSKRNVIKFKNSPQSKQKEQNQLENQQQNDQKNKNEPQFVLEPAKTQNIAQKIGHKKKSTKISLTASAKILKDFRRSDVVGQSFKNLQNENTQNEQNIKNFVRYSQTQIALQSPTLKKGIRKISQLNRFMNDKQLQRQLSDHISSPFKASFRIKHVDDNKNILMTTIKKKANSMNKQQLVQYIKNVVK